MVEKKRRSSSMKNNIQATRVRFSILAAVFITVVINYMDRTNISVAGSRISSELHLDSIRMGAIFSAFSWTYATLQIPGGLLADRFGARILYSVILILWSLVTISLSFAIGFGMIIILRMLIGAFEAPAYPINNRIVTAWFPENERAGAIATYTSGQFIGLAFLSPVLAWIQYHTGWRGLFVSTGLVGLAWGICWYFFYRNPGEHKKVNAAELDKIVSGGGFVDYTIQEMRTSEKSKWENLRFVLSKRKLWGIYLGQFGLGANLIFFLTWFPKYLVDYKHLDFLTSGFLSSLPFLCAFAGVLFSGYLSDWLTTRRVSAGLARKFPVVTGLLLSISIIGANYVSQPSWVIFFMSVAFFGNGLASITWVFVSLLAPKNMIGLTGGVFNFIGGLAGIVVPITIGWLVKEGDFSPALIFISCMTLIGALSYIFLVGRIERVQEFSHHE
jgi:MFS transporter, ACS family, D-galactonate transporter